VFSVNVCGAVILSEFFLVNNLIIPRKYLSLHWIYNCNEYKFGKGGEKL